MDTNDFISNPRSLIVEQLTESCEELFETYDTQLRVDDSDGGIKNDDGNEASLIGLLGVTALGLRATVAIQTNNQILQDTYPAELDENHEQKLQDWIGELSNQLLGRLKNKLIPYGCELTLGVPVVIQGSQLKTILPSRTEISTHSFVTEQKDDVLLILSTLIEENEFSLHAPDAETEVIAEGELLFF